MGNFAVSIPLTVKEGAGPSEQGDSEIYEADFALQGPRGGQFGEKLTLRFKVTKKPDDFEVYALALSIAESAESRGSAQPFTFEETLASLQQASYDSKKAIQTMLKKRSGDQSNAAQDISKDVGADQKMFIDDDLDNLYS